MLKKYINDYHSKSSLGYKFRLKRSIHIRKIIENIFFNNGEVKILDVGGNEIFWNTIGLDFLDKNKVQIHLVNLMEIQVENKNFFVSSIGNGTQLNFKDNQFDIVFSNSVIEHVGSYENMIKFSKEHMRVGKYYYCQTPNFWFPLEPHFIFLFFHFLPDPIKIRLVNNFNLGHFEKTKNKESLKVIESCKLIDAHMLKMLFKEGKILSEYFLFLKKSITITNFNEKALQ